MASPRRQRADPHARPQPLGHGLEAPGQRGQRRSEPQFPAAGTGLQGRTRQLRRPRQPAQPAHRPHPRSALHAAGPARHRPPRPRCPGLHRRRPVRPPARPVLRRQRPQRHRRGPAAPPPPRPWDAPPGCCTWTCTPASGVGGTSRCCPSTPMARKPLAPSRAPSAVRSSPTQAARPAATCGPGWPTSSMVWTTTASPQSSAPWAPCVCCRPLREENRAWHHGDPEHPHTRAARDHLYEVFNPLARSWRDRVVPAGVRLVHQALERELGASRKG